MWAGRKLVKKNNSVILMQRISFMQYVLLMKDQGSSSVVLKCQRQPEENTTNMKELAPEATNSMQPQAN